MQRQSLGSPGRPGGVLSNNDNESKRRDSSSSPVLAGEIKPEKHLRSPEKFVHLIPIIILFCFAVLYLSSHDPSPKDLSLFHGFKHPEKLIGENDRIDLVFQIRSLRNLQEEIQTDNNSKSNSHRKFGDF